MMKSLLVLLSLITVFSVKGQDTLEFTTRRKVADLVFGNLDSNLFGPSLIDRSLTESELLYNQLVGREKPIISASDWIQAYSDLSISYCDSTVMMTDSALIISLGHFYSKVEQDFTDELRVPFGIFIHITSTIDSSVYKPFNNFIPQNSGLSLIPTINESGIYTKKLLTGAAALELYSKHGYSEGTLVLDSNFISLSDGVSLLSVSIDFGDGFKVLDSNHPLHYEITTDYQNARAAVRFCKGGDTLTDTLRFYLTGQQYTYKKPELKGSAGWDAYPSEYYMGGDKVLEYCIKFGCGNGQSIRRPIIIAPPYRPAMQTFAFSAYYDQFNFASTIEVLSGMGYDVIFVKETPGNTSVGYAGSYLAEFLKYINVRKHEGFPDEDWETVVMGFSAGGQHWRYALKKLEWEHMNWGTPHHHTRLYIPFDSPHWGANVPMFTQAVYKSLSAMYPLAWLSYNSLCDDGSSDMLMNHIRGSLVIENGKNRDIVPLPTAEKASLDLTLQNDFNHQFTPVNDLRRSFPTFTRNIAISVGSHSADYGTTYGLYPEQNLFEQNVASPSWYGGKTLKRKIFASKYGINYHVFDRKDLYVVLGIPIYIERYYRTRYAYEWDIAQGGYKDEFYDKGGLGVGMFDLSGVPISPVQLLVASASSVIGFIPGTWGTKHYEGHMSFLPMLSSLGINPTIWNDNHLYYNLKDQKLMFNQFNFDLNDPNSYSDKYGYPNLGHPVDHFSVTPFEAIYCDPQTYEHIKMDASVAEDQLNDDYLWYTRYFIQNEVEATDVCLQNKVIGDNHIQWQPYRYKAWYKSSDNILVGELVTPKTDPGPYVIEQTGDITMYACNQVNFKPGFLIQGGGTLHAYIKCDGCNPSFDKSAAVSSVGSGVGAGETNPAATALNSDMETSRAVKVYPNPSAGKFTVEFPSQSGTFYVTDSYGRLTVPEKPVVSQKLYLDLPKGVYQLSWKVGGSLFTEKIIVL